MFSYYAYGLKILSALPLPELVACKRSKAEVTIQKGKIKRFLKSDHAESYFHMNGEEAYLFWKIVGAFLVRNGKEITVDPQPGVEESLIRLPLLSVVLATVLHQRGVPSLHANAIASNGDAIAFLGHKASGKSTLAAALYARGHIVVADDVLPLDLSGPGNPKVLPGFPQLRLMPDAVAAVLGDDSNKLPKLASIIDKCGYIAQKNFSLRPLFLKCIYVLSEGSVPEIELLQPKEALIHIIRYSFPGRVFKEYFSGAKAALHFFQCADIVEKVPVYLLKRPYSLSLLPDTARLVEEHSTANLNPCVKNIL
jgi:hypothetical protein